MHHSLLLITRKSPEVDKIMKPYSFENNGWWDWYVIGGRWSGKFTKVKLDPEKLDEYYKEFKKLRLGWISKEKTESNQKKAAHDLWRKYFGKKWEGNNIPVYRDQYIDQGFPDDSQQVNNFTEVHLKRLDTWSVIKQYDDEYIDSHCEKWNGQTFLKDDQWCEKFFDRFLKNLNPTDYLTIIDYHN